MLFYFLVGAGILLWGSGLLHRAVSYILFFGRLALNLLKDQAQSFFESDVVISHHQKIGIITFPHRGRKYQIYFPYDRRIENKMNNHEISLLSSEGLASPLHLYPGFVMPFTAEQCGQKAFRLLNLDTEATRDVESLVF